MFQLLNVVETQLKHYCWKEGNYSHFFFLILNHETVEHSPSVSEIMITSEAPKLSSYSQRLIPRCIGNLSLV